MTRHSQAARGARRRAPAGCVTLGGLAAALVTFAGQPAHAQFCVTGPGLAPPPGTITICDGNAMPGMPPGPNGDFTAAPGAIGFFFAGGGIQMSGSAISPAPPAPPVPPPTVVGPFSLTLTGPPTQIATPTFFTPAAPPPALTPGSMWIAGSPGAGTLRFSNTALPPVPGGPAVQVRSVTGFVYFPTGVGTVEVELETFGPLGGVARTTVPAAGAPGVPFLAPLVATSFTPGTIGAGPAAIVGDLNVRIFDGPAAVFLPTSATVQIGMPRRADGSIVGLGDRLGEICTVTVLGDDKCYDYVGSDVVAAPGGGNFFLKFLRNSGDVPIGPNPVFPPDNHVDHWEAEHPTHEDIHHEVFVDDAGVGLFNNDYATRYGFDALLHADAGGGIQNPPVGPHNYFWHGLGDGPAAVRNGGWQPGQTIVLGFRDPHGPAPTPWGGAVVGSTGTGFFDQPGSLTMNPAPTTVPEPGTMSLLLLGLAGLGAQLRLVRRRGSKGSTA